MKQRDIMAIGRKGFTIVELLIVIVVIAILAVITVVAYNGITKKAVESSMQSDLENARTAIALMKAGKKNYPTDANAANSGSGLKMSGGNKLTYAGSGSNYWVVATNKATSKRFCLKTGTISECTDALATTLAGTGTYSDIHDGTGAGASFSWPTGAAFGPDGNLYVADCNRAIRKVTPAGVVSTVAGSNTQAGHANGPAASALFGCMEGIAVASDGTIYVADNYGTVFRGVRKIAPNGTVSVLAGSTKGYVDATGTAAQFGFIYGIAVNNAGEVFVTDSTNYGTFPSYTYASYIRKITPAGVVTTVAGSATNGYNDGTGSAAQFGKYLQGIAIDKSNGDMYVADGGNFRIRKVTPAGVVTTVAGSGTDALVDGNGTAASFGYPTGIAIDSKKNLYITDNSPYSIRKITPSGDVTTVAGHNGTYCWAYNTGCDGLGSAAGFSWMEGGIAIDADGALYIADSDNYLIRKVIP